MIINKSGITIRMSMAELRVMGRATQGVRLINLRGSDSIAAVAKVDALEEDEILLDEEGNPNRTKLFQKLLMKQQMIHQMRR